MADYNLEEKYSAQLDQLVEQGKENGEVTRQMIKAMFDNPEDDDFIEDVFNYLEEQGTEVNREDDLPDDEDVSDEELEAEDISADDLDYSDEEEDDDFGEVEPSDADLNEEEIEIKVSDFDSDPSLFQTDDIVRMYLHEIGQIPLLEASQETTLAQDVQNEIMANERLQKAEKDGKTLSPADLEAIEKAKKDGKKARDILINSNLRLVVSIAKRHVNRGLALSDLIQEGNLGLMKAVKKYDPLRGCKFSTYATWWIRQAITRAIADKGRNVRIPVHMHECINRMSRIRRRLVQDLHRDPTMEEIAEEMKLPVEKVIELQRVARDSISFDASVGDEEDSTLIDLVPDENTPNPLEYTEKILFGEEIDTLLKELTPREEMVIRLRYGIGKSKSHTLEEVGKIMRVTRERVRQIEAKALHRLRKHQKMDRITQYM